jgi:hypothetical protein
MRRNNTALDVASHGTVDTLLSVRRSNGIRLGLDFFLQLLGNEVGIQPGYHARIARFLQHGRELAALELF